LSESGDEPSEPFSHIEDAKLRHKSISPFPLGVPVKPTIRLTVGEPSKAPEPLA
jgi:hypothetical protein